MEADTLPVSKIAQLVHVSAWQLHPLVLVPIIGRQSSDIWIMNTYMNERYWY